MTRDLTLVEGPTLQAPMVKCGDPVFVTARLRNNRSTAARVSLSVEKLKAPFAFGIDPPVASLAPNGETTVAFRWTATTPAGEFDHTFEGYLVLRDASGDVLGMTPFELYVG